MATLYDEAVQTVVGAPINLLGAAGGSTTDQGWVKMTANANIGWRWGGFNANWNIRRIGEADMSNSTAARGFSKMPAHTYHNVRVGYQLNKNAEVCGGVTNVADKQPPFFASGSSGTQALDTVPGYYDAFGRSYFVGAKFKF